MTDLLAARASRLVDTLQGVPRRRWAAILEEEFAAVHASGVLAGQHVQPEVIASQLEEAHRAGAAAGRAEVPQMLEKVQRVYRRIQKFTAMARQEVWRQALQLARTREAPWALIKDFEEREAVARREAA